MLLLKNISLPIDLVSYIGLLMMMDIASVTLLNNWFQAIVSLHIAYHMRNAHLSVNGYLYHHPAIADSSNLCPEAWPLPAYTA